jgi:hypothetical protein
MISSADVDANFEAEGAAPSPLTRVLLTFTNPSRAFARFGSGQSWWLPYLLVALVSLGFAATIGGKVGWDTVTRNSLANSPRQQARLDQVPAAQQAQQIAMIARITRTTSYVGFVIGPLFFAAIVAGILLASLNFALGGHARFGPLFAVYFFSSLPQVIKLLLATLTLLFGIGAESFQINNPIGSNPGFYLAGSAVPHWAISILSWVDVFLIWQLVLLTIGCAIVAKVSRGKAAAVVFGWTLVFIAIGGAFAAFS